jgi:acyl-coenzyme A synthetase/AMP-(fatty) acid ligase
MSPSMLQDPILHSFNRLVRDSPGAPLVVSPHRTVAVDDIDALAVVGAATVAAAGLPAGALVGLSAHNGPGVLAGLLALRRTGHAALLLDAQAPAAEGLRAARTLGAAAVLGWTSCWPQGAADLALSPVETAEPPRIAPDIAVVKLTSGSTGAPRGIATPAAALVADDAALAAAMGLRSDDRLLAAVPLSHSYGLSSLAMPALLRGTVLVVPEGTGLLDPFAAAEAAGATVFPTVPAYLEALLRLSHPPVWPATLRLVITAGAPLAPATARRFRAAFGLPVHVFYGASECGGICYDRRGDAGERGTVGTPVDGVTVALRALDGTTGGLPGARGIVTVSSPAVAAGYLPDPDPRLTGGVFTAGDLAQWAPWGEESELVLCGRIDDLINVKGKKVDPREVEGVLATLPGVDEVAVFGVPLPGAAGEGVRAVVACAAGRLTAEAVVAWCREHLAAHKVPRSVVLLGEMPRTTRGKLDRAALRTLATRPAAAGAAGMPGADCPADDGR